MVATSPTDPACALCTEVERQMAPQFEAVRTFHLTGYGIDHCMGEFDCFVKTTGRCAAPARAAFARRELDTPTHTIKD